MHKKEHCINFALKINLKNILQSSLPGERNSTKNYNIIDIQYHPVP